MRPSCRLRRKEYATYSLENLKVGDTLQLPIYPETVFVTVRVIYIHPERRFFRVRYTNDAGVSVTESFCFTGPLTPKKEHSVRSDG